MCGSFRVKDVAGTEECANCTGWIGPECLPYVEMLKRIEAGIVWDAYVSAVGIKKAT